MAILSTTAMNYANRLLSARLTPKLNTQEISGTALNQSNTTNPTETAKTDDQFNVSDPAKRLAEKIRKNQEAINQLERSRPDSVKARKLHALERLKLLEARLQAIKMAMVGSSKSVAKQLAQLARELGAAVHEYASALNESGASASTEPSSSNAVPASESGEHSETVSSDASESTEISEPTTPEENQSDTLKANAEAKPTDSFKQAVDNYVNALKQKGAEAKENQEFFQKARHLADQIKALAKQQDLRSRQLKSSSPDNELSNAMNSMEYELTTLVSGITVLPSLGNIDVNV